MIRFILALVLLLAPPAQARVPRVMTDIAPVQSLVWQVMAGGGTPGILLGRGQEPHHFQLRPSQARALSRADLLVWIGPELTPWLERAVKGVGLRGRSLVLLRVKGTVLRDFPADQGTGLDPHAWLDPENARVWLGAIAEALARIDPPNAALYRANAVAAQGRLDLLGDDLNDLLTPARGRPIIVFHDAYNYFAARFGLTIAGAVRPGDATAPGAAHIADLRARLRDLHVACAFGEPDQATAQLKSLLAGTGVRLGVLDPAGSSLKRAPDLYETLLKELANRIADCTR